MKKILYIGRFELPDKEATANRVIANAKLLRELDYEVVLAGWSADVAKNEKWKQSEYYGFKCYEKHKAKTSYEKYRMFVDATPEFELLKSEQFDMVIAYDFPAVALGKIMKYCKQNSILCIGDVSEWYTNSNKNPFFRIVRAYDSYKRMKVLHKKMDGLIVISRYLENYYKDCKTVYIPPLVDTRDEKWQLEKSDSADTIKLIYAGWPSRKKERLDLIVNAVVELSKAHDVTLDVYGITETQYKQIYRLEDLQTDKAISFHGRVSHKQTLQAVKNADFSIIARESSLKNNAGFPSKLVESITCGTPVLTTAISNVSEYVKENNNGLIITLNSIKQNVQDVIVSRSKIKTDSNLFDYHNFKKEMDTFLKGIEKI